MSSGKYEPALGVYDEASLRAAGIYWEALEYESNAREDLADGEHQRLTRMQIAVERAIAAHDHTIDEDDRYIRRTEDPTPRQLVEQRAELFNALRAACSQVDAIGGESAVYRRILDRNSTPDDIANATQQRKEPGA